MKAIAYVKGTGKSTVVEGNYFKIQGGRTIKLNTAYESQYTAGGPSGLIDGIKGTTNWRLGGWQGYQKNDFDAVVDLGKVKKISRISVGFLQQTAAWIVFPPEVEFFVSQDGKDFQSLGVLKPGIDIKDMEILTHEYVKSCKEKARYVRVKAKNYGKLPEWHESPGGDAHLFVDEITIE